MTEPTDNELDIVLSKHWPAFATMGTLPLIWTRAAFREAIAKWGTPPRISESDTDYWVRNRALILRAIEERGFRLVSSGGLFWLSGAAPPTAQAEGWTKASEQLPPCRDDQLYIGVNSAGYAGVFNAVASIAGNVHCMYETPEETIDVMSDLSIWKPFNPPTSAEGVEHV